MTTKPSDTSTTARETASRPDTSTAVRIRVSGIVARGDQRGRTIGFPTANIALESDGVQLADGVYAGYFHPPSGSALPCAVSIGRRTTFYGTDGVRLLEAHILDWTGDLYEQHVEVELLAWLRGQVAFADVGELHRQLQRDILRAAEVLTLSTPGRCRS